MADGFTGTVDASGLLAAMKRLGETTVLRYTKPASLATANALVSEMQRRIRRDTGQTADGIYATEMRNGTGYVVLTSDQREDAGEFTRGPGPPGAGKGRIAKAYKQEKHVALWLEAGTRQGKPRSHTQAPMPFFWPSVRLEIGAHERRISDAVGAAIRAEGLGA